MLSWLTGDGYLYLFARFFAIMNQTDANKFVQDYSRIELGKELIMAYNDAVSDPTERLTLKFKEIPIDWRML